jgi:hypothetical protein
VRHSITTLLAGRLQVLRPHMLYMPTVAADEAAALLMVAS